MQPTAFSFAAPVWEHEGEAAWYFLSLPERVADEIADLAEGRTSGFGSVRVAVSIGSSAWSTSLFPDSKRGTYVLPLKKAIRLAEGLGTGSVADVTLTVLL